MDSGGEIRRMRFNGYGGSGVDQGPATGSSGGAYEAVGVCLIPYVKEARDRHALSLVCKAWYEIDSFTRKSVTVALCYSATPKQLSRRFPNLESLELKGKPRSAMFNLIPEDWGGFVTPWVEEIARSLGRMKVLHFRRMIVKDSDLRLLASSNGKILEVLRLDKCSGFSTDGLLHVARLCRNLKIFFMEESTLDEKDGEWLHELAENNTVLEYLNFYTTEISKVKPEDLELIARRCPSLVSMKISDYDLSDLLGFFRSALSLEEFAGGCFREPVVYHDEAEMNEQLGRLTAVVFPPRLCKLGITYLGKAEMPVVYPIASSLKKLDLLYALLDTESHCRLLQLCRNLEILEARSVIGDRGLVTVASFCNGIKKLRIERGADENDDIEDLEGIVTQRGLMAVAQGCPKLEYFAVYVTDITNESLAHIGRYSKELNDFRLVLLERQERITDLPLDRGVRALLTGCHKLERFALYLRPGGLTDIGLSYIGHYSNNIKWMLLGFVGESDIGLLEFSRGCPKLQKLEMRGCCFSERAIAIAAAQLPSLRYLWVQGYLASGNGQDLSLMIRPFWNIELIPARQDHIVDISGNEVVVEHPAHILAYYSLAGPRGDFPASVRPLGSM